MINKIIYQILLTIDNWYVTFERHKQKVFEQIYKMTTKNATDEPCRFLKIQNGNFNTKSARRFPDVRRRAVKNTVVVADVQMS